MDKGIILNIQRFCLDDGPGIRTTIFLKGCPLHCLWCHNPESQNTTPEVMYDANHCVSCMQCERVCQHHLHIQADGKHQFLHEGCTLCGHCTSICPQGALQKTGYTETADTLMTAVLRDQAYYQTSGGGITLSGGEPLIQPDFSVHLLKTAKDAGIHTAIETCGFAAQDVLQRFLPVTDLFLYDYKATEPALHRHLTGVDNKIILSNLRYLVSQNQQIILRCPLVPGVNDTQEHLLAISALCQELSLRAEIMPYHPLGTDKLRRLGRFPQFQAVAPDERQIDLWKQAIGEQYIV